MMREDASSKREQTCIAGGDGIKICSQNTFGISVQTLYMVHFIAEKGPQGRRELFPGGPRSFQAALLNNSAR